MAASNEQGVSAAPANAFARWVSAAVAVIGALMLLVWALRPSTEWVPAWAMMKANTALGLMILGIGMVAVAWLRAGAARTWTTAIAGAGALLLGGLTLSQDLTGWNLGIDQLLFADPPWAPEPGMPGRMAPVVALNFMLSGAALLLFIRGGRRVVVAAQVLVLVMLVLVLLALIGYAYGVRGFYQIPSSPHYTAMSLYSALSFTLVGVALLSMRPDIGPASLVTRPSLGGRLARGLLPLAIGLPFLLGALHAWIDRVTFYPPTYATALFTVINILLFALLIGWYAARIGRIDEAREQAQAAERLERERYQTTLASIGDGVIATDLAGRVRFINPVAEMLTGWSRDEAVGQPAERVFHVVRENTGERAMRPITHVLETHEMVELENHALLVTRDGREQRPIADSAAPIRNGDGQMVGVVLVFRDITERRRAEITSRRLAAIVESSDDAIISATPDGTVLSWNSGAERLYGYSAEEMIDQPISVTVPSERMDELRELLERLRRGEHTSSFDTVRLRKDGKRVEISLTISPVFDANGEVVAASAIARDITERRRAEAVQRLLAFIVASSDDAITSKKLDGTITSWNQGAEAIYGYTAEEAIGQHVSLLMPEERRNEADAILAKVGRGERVEHYETVRVRKDGRRIMLSLTVSPLRDEAGRIIGASIIGRDITERVQARLELEQLNQELEQRVAARTAEAEARAQQLQTLARQLSAAEQKERERIARTLHDHLQQLLVAAKMAINVQPAPVARQINQEAEPLERAASLLDEAIQASRDLTVELYPPVLFESGLAAALHWLSDHFERLYQLPVTVEADPDAEPDTSAVRAFMFQCGREMLLNVVKHSQCDDGADVHLRLVDQFVQLEVHDCGVGCDPETAFATEASQESLGLRDLRQRAHLLGGGLWMESDNGCRVVVQVPRHAEDASQSHAA